MRKSGSAKPHKCKGYWYLIRRVPREFEQLDRRGTVRISTDIAIADDPRAARAAGVVEKLDKELQAYWRGLGDGQSAEARIRFEAARKRARALGLPYLTNAEIGEGALSTILERIQVLINAQAVESESDVAAVLGGEQRPSYRLSEMLAEFEAIMASALAQMSKKQQHKWRLPKRRALDNLLAVVGDKAMDAATRADAVSFRLWWQDRIRIDGVQVDTANKDIGHINKMWRSIDLTHTMGLKPIWSSLRIEGGVDKQRAAFEPEHVQKTILSDGALDDLNEEARRLIMLLSDSGLRPSEACNLNSTTIVLDAKVPHVKVLPDGRKLKTDHSAREIPLVGAALAAMKLQPNGFPRYRDKADSLSALVNKYLDNNAMLPTADHSLYSLRHTFEDRLTAIEAPEKIVAMLMGHKWHRPRYGVGPSLEQKLKWLKKIAFTPPVHV